MSAVAAVKPQRRGRAQQWPPAGWHMDDNGEIQRDVATAVADALTSIDQQMRAKAATVYSIAGDERERFELVPADKFLDRPPARWLIKGVLPAAQIGAVVGQPGAGKSPMMYSMAASIHRGADWFGHRVRKGRAVYLVAEGAADFRNRIRAYAKEFDVDPADLPLMIDDVPNLKTAADAALIAKKVGAADAIFFDTFAACFIGAENSSEDIGPVLAHLKFISEKTGAMCVCAFHPGKSLEKGIRGFSGILAALDCEITISKQGDYRSAAITKQKAGAEAPLFDFKIKVHTVGEDEDGDPVTSVVIEPCEPPKESRTTGKTPRGKYVDEITGALREAGSEPVSVRELREAIIAKFPRNGGKSDNRKMSFNRALDNLTEAAIVETLPDSDGELIQLRIRAAQDPFA